jgi:hypothetical protein
MTKCYCGIYFLRIWLRRQASAGALFPVLKPHKIRCAYPSFRSVSYVTHGNELEKYGRIVRCRPTVRI